MDKFLTKNKPSTSTRKENETLDNDDTLIQEDPPAKKVKKHKYNFNDKWLVDITFKNWLSKKEQKDGSILAFCKVCNCSILNHKPALVKHVNTLKHKQSLNAISNTSTIEQVFKPKEEEEQTRRAELKLCAFIAQHNLPLSLCDNLVPFLENTFPGIFFNQLSNYLYMRILLSANRLLCSLARVYYVPRFEIFLDRSF